MLSILLMGLSLSMDAFALSAANSMSLKNFTWRHGLRMAAWFGAFQFFMPLLGAALGDVLRDHVRTWGGCLSFFILAFLGCKMVLDSFGAEGRQGLMSLSTGRLFVMALATSIDAFAAGLGFALGEAPPLLPGCAVIGGVTFVLCLLGGLGGGRFAALFGKRPGIFGGIVLIAIAVKALLGSGGT